MADRTLYTADEPFEPMKWDGDNLDELRELAGQDLTVNEDGSITVRMGPPSGDGEDYDVPVGWYVRVAEADGAVGVSSPGAAARWRRLEAA